MCNSLLNDRARFGSAHRQGEAPAEPRLSPGAPGFALPRRGLDTRRALPPPRSPLRPSLVEAWSEFSRSLVAVATAGLTTVLKPRRAKVIGRRQKCDTQISYALHPSTAAHSTTVFIRHTPLPSAPFALFTSR
jgi:hypothetical protein